jgi:hypothetical protein
MKLSLFCQNAMIAAYFAVSNVTVLTFTKGFVAKLTLET